VRDWTFQRPIVLTRHRSLENPDEDFLAKKKLNFFALYCYIFIGFMLFIS